MDDRIISNNILSDDNEELSIRPQTLKEYVGHTPAQVIAGILIGIVIGYLVCTFL